MLNTKYKMTETNAIKNINIVNSPCVFDTWEKHFGAYFKQDGSSIFTLFTFPDVDYVKLEVKPCNSPILSFDMKNIKSCIWSVQLDKDIVKNGDSE